MKTTVIACGFPLPPETFILRHVKHFHADVVCGRFLPELLKDRDQVGEIAADPELPSTVLNRSLLPSLALRASRRLRRVMRPALEYEWSASMYRHWAGYLESHRPDVVLAEFAPNALGAMPECRRRGIPLVAHFHGYDATALMRIRAYRRAIPGLFANAAAVVCVSSFMREVLLAAGCARHRLHVIPCGAPLSEFPFSENTGAQPCTFLAVSRLAAGKGPMIALRAFHRVVSQRPQTRLVFAGDGPMRRELAHYVRRHSLEHAVTLAGCVSNEEVRRLMGSSTVFVQASLRDKRGWLEGWGVSLAEALASGLPAVVSRSGGMTDLVSDTHNGFLFEPGDWRAMAGRMVQLADAPALRLRMGRAARAHVEKVGSTENSLRDLEAVLQGVVSRAPSPGTTCRR
jgi:glycosyltransferase involved in cell wall biosynthesis